ncbi:hypothetical protein GLOIN_2v1866772 [Rhizophagus irregularis DAOM 181602=DAOM 197198]|nr:hypothetical protein GLOIN_2v1866772 [Rhizophagus irregularis DAOM 181602=DAOM 197198]
MLSLWTWEFDGSFRFFWRLHSVFRISLDIGFWAFSQIFGYEILVLAILSGNGEFYSSISYTVIKDNQEPVRLKLHIGDIVDIVDLNEESKVSGDELC